MGDKRFCYDYPRPSVTVDLALFRRRPSGGEEVLLIRRKNDPFRGRWALPGGYVDSMEPLEAAARRELREETGQECETLVQVGAFGDPGRDPRGHTISIAFAGRLDGDAEPEGGDDAEEARWMPLEEAKDLAFDHDLILRQARGVVERSEHRARIDRLAVEQRTQKA